MQSQKPARQRSEPARRRNAAATRLAILASARQAFALAGYEGAGVREIARGAGVTAMLVNRYFGSKEQLFAEVIAQAMTTPVILSAENLASDTPGFRRSAGENHGDRRDPARWLSHHAALGLERERRGNWARADRKALSEGVEQRFARRIGGSARRDCPFPGRGFPGDAANGRALGSFQNQARGGGKNSRAPA